MILEIEALKQANAEQTWIYFDYMRSKHSCWSGPGQMVEVKAHLEPKKYIMRLADY